jgi:Niemann-Pick C1 protein
VLESCCRVRIADPETFCGPDEPARRCQPCFLDRDPPFDITMAGLPESDEFMRYVRQWLESPTGEDCPLAGKSSYGNAVALAADNSSIVASHFRTYHTPLKTQDDFINALAAANRVAADLSAQTGARVYPYSLFYVFFDQYAHVGAILVQVMVLALGAVMLVTTVLLGSWQTAALVTATCALVVFNVMGTMGFWGINLNAISLVNLVISLGIAVEFTAHVARAFLGAGGGGLPYDHPSAAKDRDERAWAALVDVGSSVSRRAGSATRRLGVR